VAARNIAWRKLGQTLIAPEYLQHDVIANGVDVGPQPFRVFNGPLPETPKYAQQSFLANVVGGVPRS
jgi:hypothetical protein